MSFTRDNHFGICFYKVHFDIRLVFLLEFREFRFSFKEILKSFFSVHNALFNRFTANIFYPNKLLIIGYKLIIQPFWKLHTWYKPFFRVIYLSIVSKIEVINESAYSNSTINYLFLLKRWIYFCLVTL